MGIMVKNGDVDLDPQVIDLPNLSEGIYFIRILGNNTFRTFKVIMK